MIPLSDVNPTRNRPYINWLLIGINVLVFLYEWTLPTRQLDRLIFTWGAIPSNLLSGLFHPLETPLPVWLTLITAQFLHAGWLHIGGNMLFLWIFGDNVEDILGHFSYLIFYLFSGIVANLIESFVGGPTQVPTIGASGAIAGVLGAYLVLFPWAKVRILIPVILFLWTVQVPAVIVLGWWFVQEIFYGMASLSSVASEGIAFWAHIGGFVTGMILIVPFVGRVYRRRAPTYVGFDEEL